jgi:hypothetical protein
MVISPARTLRSTPAAVARYSPSALALFALTLSALALSGPAWGDTGVGVDTWRANKLDPTGGEATEPLDMNGTSWLEPGQHRSPTGNL